MYKVDFCIKAQRSLRFTLVSKSRVYFATWLISHQRLFRPVQKLTTIEHDNYTTTHTMSEADFIPLEQPGSSKRERAAPVPSTVFVSSLPYNATSTDLTTHFSFVGPIRHGFVAMDRESGKSKGVGYITYALPEDAERAVQELDGSAFGAKGRKIRVTMADKKPSMLERKVSCRAVDVANSS